jgi:hypothetical protein
MVYMYVTLLCSATKGENMHIQWHIKLCVDVATVPHPTGSPTLRPSAPPPSPALHHTRFHGGVDIGKTNGSSRFSSG